MLKSLKKSSGRWLLAFGIALGMIAGYAFHVSRNQDGNGAQLDAADSFPTLEKTQGGDAGEAEQASSADSSVQAADSNQQQVPQAAVETDKDRDTDKSSGEPVRKLAKATFGMGCFWCSEAFFESLKGVVSVEAGYSGGRVPDPTYAAVCSGTTGHAEVAQITYDPETISYEKLLEVFWRTHDPTTLNRQGNDYGEQYRSVLFYHDKKQKELAEKYRKLLDDAEVFGKPIVTQIQPLEKFYKAEDDHQDYYKKNSERMYCRFHIRPTLEKMREVFGDAVK